jgi:peptide/nickel transport system permease protein
VRILGQRLLQLVPIIFLVSLGAFLLVDLLPGDPVFAILGENATPETIAALREELNLDENVMVRYADWLGNAATGDLGISIRSERPVMTEFLERAPVTAQLAAMAMGISLLLALPLGMISAYRAGKAFDRATAAASFAFVSIPPFVLGLVLVYLLPIQLGWFKVSGWERLSDGLGANLDHAILPALSLALGELAVYSQLLKADMSATLEEDFVLAAKAKGMPTWHVLFRHALRPSSFSLITLAGVNLGRLLGGTLIVEQLFGLPGVGRLIYQSIPSKDITVIQGSVLILAVTYLLINTLIDLSYSVIDPRVRRESTV